MCSSLVGDPHFFLCLFPCFKQSSRQSCGTFWTGIESACSIGRRQNQLPPAQINLGELDGRVPIIKPRKRLAVAFAAQQTSWDLLCSCPRLLNSSGYKDAFRTLVEHDGERCSSANDIYHDVDVIRACFRRNNRRGRKEDVQIQVIFLTSSSSPSPSTLLF